MDDVFGELDTYRANRISAYLREIGQAFITLTDFSKVESIDIKESDKTINVMNGSISYVS